MYYVIFSFISLLVIGSLSSVESNTVKTYDSKVCNNEPSCYLINELDLPKNLRTLAGRDCMCDWECVEYGDCCADSPFYTPAYNSNGKSYSCSLDWQIYMLTSCPAGYTNQAILSKCLSSLKPLNGPDNSVIRPATNTKTHITYGNIYCALCNNDTDVVIWNLSARCGEAPAGYLDPATSNSTTPENKIEVSTETVSKISEPQMEISTLKNKITSTTAAPKTSKPLISLSLGANPSLEISLGSKNFKSTLNTDNLFNRPKRQSPGIDYNKYQKDLDNILDNVRYDDKSQHFVSQYNGKSFICEFTSQKLQDFDTNVRICIPNMVSSCPTNTDQQTVQKCLSNTAIVYEKISKQAYKNKHCAGCNNITEANLTGCPQPVRISGTDLFSTSDKGATPPCNDPAIKGTPLCQG